MYLPPRFQRMVWFLDHTPCDTATSPVHIDRCRLVSAVVCPRLRTPSDLTAALFAGTIEHGGQPAPAAQPVPRQGRHDQGETTEHEQLRPGQGPHRQL